MVAREAGGAPALLTERHRTRRDSRMNRPHRYVEQTRRPLVFTCVDGELDREAERIVACPGCGAADVDLQCDLRPGRGFRWAVRVGSPRRVCVTYLRSGPHASTGARLVLGGNSIMTVPTGDGTVKTLL